MIRKCIDRIINNTDYDAYEICLVNNFSISDEAQEFIAAASRIPRVRVISIQRPFNYSELNNIAVYFVQIGYDTFFKQ